MVLFAYFTNTALAGRKNSRRFLASGGLDSSEDVAVSFDCLSSDSCKDGENPSSLQGTNACLFETDSVDVLSDSCRGLVGCWASWKYDSAVM